MLQGFQVDCYGSLGPWSSSLSPADRRRVARDVIGIPSLVPRLPPVPLLLLCHVVSTWAPPPIYTAATKDLAVCHSGQSVSTTLRPATVHVALIVVLRDIRRYCCCVDYCHIVVYCCMRARPVVTYILLFFVIFGLHIPLLLINSWSALIYRPLL